MSLTSTPAFPPCSERKRQEQLDQSTDVDGDHGRIEVRTLQASNRLVGHLDWPGFAQAIRIERTRTIGEKRSTEVSYAITSVSRDRASASELLKFNRNHWQIENRLHWVRDVVFGEDKCRARSGDLPQNLAALRNATINLLRSNRCKGIASALRHFATKPYDLLEVLCRFKK